MKAWSYNRLKTFEKCPYRARLAYLDRIPEPPRVLKEGQVETPADFGIRIHKCAEDYVRGQGDLVPEMSKFAEEFDKLKSLYADGKVELEGDWAVDAEWNPVGWSDPTVWLRLKLDAFVQLTEKHALVVDYKTGKLFGNEVSHIEQGQLYQLAAFMRDPGLERIDVEFWYLTTDELTRVCYTKSLALKVLPMWTARASKMTEERTWAPRPNRFNCKWCPYKPIELGGSGHCAEGV